MAEKGLIKVRSIEEEHKHIERSRCECGGEMTIIMQMLEPGDVDCLQARCDECGEEREFRFDISGIRH